MLEVIGAAPGAHTDINWPGIWRQSREYQAVQDELRRLVAESQSSTQNSKATHTEFAAPFSTQFWEVTKRAVQQYWRSPAYLYSKAFLSCGAVSYHPSTLYDDKYSRRSPEPNVRGVHLPYCFQPQLVDQILPIFVSQRTMYEARERPSKAYSWMAFLGANFLIEALWNSLMGVFSFILWYYPIGLYRNARHTNAVHSRGATVFLFVWVFFLFSSSFAHLVIAGMDSHEVAGGLVGLMTILMFSFCGVIAGPHALPRFWIFMYRVNPFTYFVEGFLGTALADAPASCDDNDYISMAGGFVADPDAADSDLCEYCAISETNRFLKLVNINFDNRWRNFGIMWVFIIFNIFAAAGLYWLARVPKRVA
ncbi:multidrug resistance protein CDR1 [Thelonectria olida]|uniref:Multidrug resistance protein CDR1 n=1 Tax=Thelonectria olida TaxID=1576542 RepID=A0A9P9AKC4_9HYPO|nr:multidrug resistance protein CDR1 [Thelonectria olida]